MFLNFFTIAQRTLWYACVFGLTHYVCMCHKGMISITIKDNFVERLLKIRQQITQQYLNNTGAHVDALGATPNNRHAFLYYRAAAHCQLRKQVLKTQ